MNDLDACKFRVFADCFPLYMEKEGQDNKFKLKIQIVLRRAPFYEATNELSASLGKVGSMLFNNRGSPKPNTNVL